MIQCKFIDAKGFNRIINMSFRDLESLPSNWWIVIPCPPQRRFIKGGPTEEAWGIDTPKSHFTLVFPGHKYAMPVYEEVVV